MAALGEMVGEDAHFAALDRHMGTDNQLYNMGYVDRLRLREDNRMEAEGTQAEAESEQTSE